MKKQKKKKSEEKPVPLELTKRVKNLWEKDENSAHALGKALDEVKECNPRQFMKWIERNIGNSLSIRNRCSYCLRVFRGKIPPKGKSGSNADSAVEKMIHEVKERFKQLYDYAQTGDVDSAVMTAKIINQKADELVEVAKRNEKPTERAKAATA